MASGILNRLACAEMSLGAAGKSACATKTLAPSLLEMYKLRLPAGRLRDGDVELKFAAAR